MNRRKAIKSVLLLTPAGYIGFAGGQQNPRFRSFAESQNGTVSAAGHGPYRPWIFLLDPREYPDDARRFTHPPDWKFLGNKTHFVTFRVFQVEDDQIVRYKENLDAYTLTHQLGDVIWPAAAMLTAQNLTEVVDEIKKRELFLFDIWGYIPASDGRSYGQFRLPEQVGTLLTEKLGDHWWGMDNGEEDGRYIGRYAPQIFPVTADRKQRYINFHHFFAHLAEDLGYRLCALVSLNFGHYFIKEGYYSMIGAEAAQALPNNQVYYSFIRGGGKQYGVPWFGNASVYNRWGSKSYDTTGEDHGPTKGTSLSLLTRLLYSHILYNSMVVGFEAGWVLEKSKLPYTLSPIGHIQQAAVQWTKKFGMPGAMYTPVALMLDFFAGWTFPRHLYTDDVYKVWGGIPYEAGDYLTDETLRILYPGYEDSSYFHDERGFISPTPYGDIADCMLSDAEGWLLRRYAVLMIAGEISGGVETHDKLVAYVAAGGHLIITAANLSKFPDGIRGVEVDGLPRRHPAHASVTFKKNKLTEDNAFDYYPLSFPGHSEIIAKSTQATLAVHFTSGSGQITVLAASYGISGEIHLQVKEKDKAEGAEERAMPSRYPMLRHVDSILRSVFQSQSLFTIDNPDLSLITCCKEQGHYTVAVTNNFWKPLPFSIQSHIGSIESIKELPVDDSQKDAVGYTPENIDITMLGTNQQNIIAGGSIRIFAVAVGQDNSEPIQYEKPPARPINHFLPLWQTEKIEDSILVRPTFFVHFNGLVIDWKYLERREKTTLQNEAVWINKQDLQLIIDLSSGTNLYPDLRLVDNLHAEYLRSMERIESVMDKMKIIGTGDLILALHGTPENFFSDAQQNYSQQQTLVRLCNYAAELKINIHLRVRFDNPSYGIREAIDFIDNVNRPNLKLAPMLASLYGSTQNNPALLKLLGEKTGLWLVASPEKSIDGNLWNLQKPLAGFGNHADILRMTTVRPDLPIVLDAVYANADEEYADSVLIGI